jgi:hypothetical protein
MLVTVPTPLAGEEIVKFGYVPVTVVAPEPVRATTWSGAVLVTVMEPDVVTGPPETLTPVPAVKLTLVTVPVFDVKPDGLLAGYAPRFVRAVGALVAPVPPLAILIGYVTDGIAATAASSSDWNCASSSSSMSIVTALNP